MNHSNKRATLKLEVFNEFGDKIDGLKTELSVLAVVEVEVVEVSSGGSW